jgi:cytochrome c5
MKHAGQTMLACLVMATAAAAGQAKNEAQKGHSHSPAKEAHAMNQSRGQEVFNQNCSRCHDAPEGFSPSISGTIAMHMRVRANLSQADYEALLRFLKP